MKYRYPFVLLTATISLILMSWGYTGHRTIGRITESYLSANAKAAVKDLLGDEDIADAATWADEARKFPELKETANWHFLNLPLGLSYKDFKNMVDTMKQANVYSALIKAEGTLKQKTASKKEKINALKFVLHFVGDIHQPMHVSRAEDKGGNTIQLNYEGKGTNLHSLIDTKLLEHQGLKFDSLALKFNQIPKRKVRRWQKTPIIKWAWESYKISSKLYAEVDKMETRTIGDDYYKEHIGMVEERIQQASIRLAGLLNEIYKDGYQAE